MMQMPSFEIAAAEFLSKPENFETALEIAERIPEAKGLLYLKFWRSFKGEVDRFLERGSRWKSTLDKDSDLKNLRSHRGLELTPIDSKDKALHLNIRVTPDGGFLYFAIQWSEQRDDFQELVRMEQVSQLIRRSNDMPPKDSKWNAPENWALGWRWLDCNLTEKAALVSLSKNDGFPEEVAGEAIRVFKEIEECLAQANVALGKHPITGK
jgi:hypothetical protein